MCLQELFSQNNRMELTQSTMRSEDCTCGTNSSDWLSDVKKSFPSYMYSNPFADVSKCDQSEEIQHCSVCMKGFYNCHELQEHERTHMGGVEGSLNSNRDKIMEEEEEGAEAQHASSSSSSSDCDMLRCGSTSAATCSHTMDCEINSSEEIRPRPHNHPTDKGSAVSSGRVANRNNKRLSEASSTTTATYPCELCGEKFALRGNLLKHKKMHDGQRPFACPVCGKEFSLRGNMKKHQAIHEGTKPFNCNICGRQFSLRGNLQQHQVVHTGAKPFNCSVCGRQFSLRGNMEKHKRIHNY